MKTTDLDTINAFLGCPTPEAWVDCGLDNLETLLIDHANCEKKAAGTALNLLYRYQDDFVLIKCLSRLAREELRHFEQVVDIIRHRAIAYRPLTAARYAAGLHQLVRTSEPARRVDTLLVSAFIEARSCERFACIAPRMDDELREFYTSLLRSEARHYRDYLSLAKNAAGDHDLEERVSIIRAKEQQLIESPDTEFRFHSGVP